MKRIAFVGVLALAAGTAVAWNGPGAGMVVLHQSVAGALSMTGNSSVYVPTRAVYVNSSSSQAVRTSGAATLDTPVLNVVGGTAFNGQSMATGTVNTGCTPVENPLSGFAIPNDPGTDRGSTVISGGSHVLQPGYYPTGIDISGNATVTMEPGVYQINGVGFKFRSGTLTGNGVTIIILGGVLDLAGNSLVNLSPPESGPTAHVVIAQAWTNTSQMSLAGTADVQITGAICAPNNHLLMVGNSVVEGQGPLMGDLVVAKTVELKGTALIQIGREGRQAIVPMRQPLYD